MQSAHAMHCSTMVIFIYASPILPKLWSDSLYVVLTCLVEDPQVQTASSRSEGSPLSVGHLGVLALPIRNRDLSQTRIPLPSHNPGNIFHLPF